MIETVYKCNVCRVERGPTNHWLLVRAGGSFSALRIEPWNDAEATSGCWQHICGQKCAHVVLDRYLNQLREG